MQTTLQASATAAPVAARRPAAAAKAAPVPVVPLVGRASATRVPVATAQATRVQQRNAQVCHAAAAPAPPSAGAVDESAVLDAVVVGAGISGLCTAQALKQKHGDTVSNFLVTEARERVGGNITSMTDGKYVWEEGPNSFQPNDSMLEAAVDASVDDKLVLGDPNAPRFVFWDGRLRATPSSNPISAITFDLLSWFGKIRAGLGAVGLYKSGPPPEKEESVEEFIRRNLGAEVFERLIEPFCSGVYAGDPSKLSMSAAFGKIHVLEGKGGSLVGGALKLMQENKENPPPPRDARLPPKPKGATVGSFYEGLQTLPKGIAEAMPERIRCNWKLEAISKADGIFNLKYSTPDGERTLRAKSVVMTAPSYVVADLVKEQAPEAAEALNSFDYPPVAAVTMAYPESSIRDDRKAADGTIPGFGQLHPRSQGITTLGTIYSSSLFPDRAPKGEMLVLCYIGGATNRGILDQTDDEIYAQVDKDVRVMLVNKDAPPPVKVGLRVWPRAIPQFNVGHQAALDKAEKSFKDAGLDGLMLGGNYVSGVALGKCVEYGYRFAGDVANYVKSAAK